MDVWFITGAGSGLGAAIARAALSSGHAVVATGRRLDPILDALDDADAADRLLPLTLDVTVPADSVAATATAVEHFGRIDVLVNNAGASYKGYFEEMSAEQVASQIAVNLLGPMHVARAVLPVMRAQRSGLLVTMSSGAGLIGFEYSSVYAATKAGIEGWATALAAEVLPFGIHSTIVNPGFFRTALASPESMVWPEYEIEDYAERSTAQRAWWSAQDGGQPGDPDKLAAALVTLCAERPTPRRFIAGADVIALAERKARELLEDLASHRSLSESLTFDEPTD